jgi:hypothetical protein
MTDLATSAGRPPVVSVCQSKEDVRSLRAAGQLAHERLEHVTGAVMRRIKRHTVHLVTSSRRGGRFRIRADHGDRVM